MSGGRTTFEAVIVAMLKSVCETCQRCGETYRELKRKWDQFGSS